MECGTELNNESAGWCRGAPLLALLVFGLATSCSDDISDGWDTEAERRYEVTEGLYDVALEVRRDECRGPELRNIVDSNSNWPPETIRVRVFHDPDEGSTSATVDAYTLRFVGNMHVSEFLADDATNIGEHFGKRTREMEPDDGGRCPATLSNRPMYETEMTVDLLEDNTFSVNMTTKWRGFAECTDEEHARSQHPWIPENMPCTESYAYKYTLAKECPSYKQCDVHANSDPTPEEPNRGFDYRCECPSRDAGMNNDAGG